jgi:hypothetical protein
MSKRKNKIFKLTSIRLAVGGLAMLIFLAAVLIKNLLFSAKPSSNNEPVAMSDTIAPLVKEVSSLGDAAEISLTPATSATPSSDVVIVGKELGEIRFALTFSENGTLIIDPLPFGELTWQKEATASPAITIAAGTKPFTTRYLFTDQAGLSVRGTLNYSYDTILPKITLVSRSEVTNRYSLKYLAAFTVSEPIVSSYVLFNGQKIVARLTPPDKYTASMVLVMGSNTFSISATDSYGNTTVQNFTVTMTEDPYPKKSPLSPDYRFCTREIKKPCDEQYPDYQNNCSQWDQYVLCVRAKCDSPIGNNKCL